MLLRLCGDSVDALKIAWDLRAILLVFALENSDDYSRAFIRSNALQAHSKVQMPFWLEWLEGLELERIAQAAPRAVRGAVGCGALGRLGAGCRSGSHQGRAAMLQLHSGSGGVKRQRDAVEATKLQACGLEEGKAAQP